MAKEVIIQKMKDSGCRITKQRMILLDIILEEDCSCCKEIYFKASKKDSKIGVATVYRISYDQFSGRNRSDQPQEYV